MSDSDGPRPPLNAIVTQPQNFSYDSQFQRMIIKYADEIRDVKREVYRLVFDIQGKFRNVAEQQNNLDQTFRRFLASTSFPPASFDYGPATVFDSNAS